MPRPRSRQRRARPTAPRPDQPDRAGRPAARPGNAGREWCRPGRSRRPARRRRPRSRRVTANSRATASSATASALRPGPGGRGCRRRWPPARRRWWGRPGSCPRPPGGGRTGDRRTGRLRPPRWTPLRPRHPLGQLLGVVDAEGGLVEPRVDREVGEVGQKVEPGAAHGCGDECFRSLLGHCGQCSLLGGWELCHGTRWRSNQRADSDPGRRSGPRRRRPPARRPWPASRPRSRRSRLSSSRPPP